MKLLVIVFLLKLYACINIFVKVFKNGSSKICGDNFKNFTLSILEYLDPYLSICILFQQLLETSHQTK